MDVGAANLAVDVLLAVGVVAMFVCVAGVLVMRTTFDRMHYASAGASVPPLFFLAAVLVREGLSGGGLEAIAAVALMFLLNPVVLTATARAARRIDFGTEQSLPEERERS
jgi:multisubunit Na+/H+ antiporter MnhG subunit